MYTSTVACVQRHIVFLQFVFATLGLVFSRSRQSFRNILQYNGPLHGVWQDVEFFVGPSSVRNGGST